MKAKYQFALNKYIVEGHAKRRGDTYILDPWGIPENDYESLVKAMTEEYTASLSKEGMLLTPKRKK